MPYVKKQHYVPRFYLSGFTSEDNDKLYVFDKENSKIFMKNIKEICEQNYFYSFYEQQEEYNFMLEEHLGKKENQFSCVFRKLIDNIEDYYYKNNGKLDKLARNEKKIILEFIFYQIIRVPKYVDKLFSMIIPQFNQFNKEDGVEQSKRELINDIKKYTFPKYFDRAEEIISILSRKNWTFFILSKKLSTSFISSDNPVILSNSNLQSPIRGALIDPMTEISFPISKNIALALMEKNVTYKYNYRIVDNIDYVKYINGLLLNNAYRFAYSNEEYLLSSLTV
jgi:hypothetical protein